MAKNNDSEIRKKKPHADAAYQQVMDDIRLRIARGEWRQGERIPTVDELEREYPFSRMTVFRAVRELKHMGLLESRNRGGTVVARSTPRGQVGVLFPLNFTNPSHAEFTYRVAHYVREQSQLYGFEPLLFEEDRQPYPHDVPSRKMMETVRAGRLQGVISVQSFLPRWRLDTNVVFRVPTVDIGIFPSPYRVYIDFEEALTVGVRHLTERGCRCIGLVGNLPPQKTLIKKQAHVFDYAALDDWLRTDPTQTTEEFGFRALQEIWQAEDKPDALYISDDVIAKGVAQATLALGIRVPQELRLVCMANREIERFYPCAMDRVEVNLEELAGWAVHMLMRVLDHTSLSGEVSLVKPAGVTTAPMPRMIAG